MAKVAKLVLISMMTRVVVDADASEEEILEASKKNFHNKIDNELSENVEKMGDDPECPYDPEYDEPKPLGDQCTNYLVGNCEVVCEGCKK